MTCLPGGWVSDTNLEGHKETFQLSPASTYTSSPPTPIFFWSICSFTWGPLYRSCMRLSCWG